MTKNLAHKNDILYRIVEYSVFGSPQQKIGDFTQSKLSGWSQ